jgi:VWFA-related protein
LLHGQTAGQAPAEPLQQGQVFKTDVNEVSLDLLVHDKRHNAVLDLKPDELQVTDDGVPVKLSEFHLVSGPAAAGRGHLVTLLFDPFMGATALSARIVAGKILGVLPTAGYTFCVLDLKGRLRLVQGFTSDRTALDQAIHIETESQPIILNSSLTTALSIVHDEKADKAKADTVAAAEKNLIAITQTGVDSAGHAVGVVERGQSQTLATALRDSQAISQEQRGRLSLAGLLALVKAQESLGDRKTIIYFTANQQLDPASKKMLSTITAAAASAAVSVYTVDMEAINNGGPTDQANAMMNAQAPATGSAQQQSSAPIHGPTIVGANGYPAGQDWGPQQDIAVMTDFMRNGFEDLTNPFADTKNPMADLSKATGGLYIDAQNSTKKPLQQMVQDLSTFYQASYIPPFKEYDGKFRSISVKPLRANLNIQTKSGYFALAGGAAAGTQPFEGPLLKSLTDATLPTDLKFDARVVRFGELPDGNTSTLGVEVPLAQLATKQDAKTNLSSAHVSIVAQVKDDTGTVIEHYSEDITKKGVAETLKHDHDATIFLGRHFILTPGKYVMEVAVLDQNSGKAGAERKNFEIAAQASPVALSDMVLVRKMEGSHEEEDDPLEPMRYEHKKVTPNLTGEVPTNDGKISLFFILHPDPESSDAMKLEMQLTHNGKAGKRVSLMEEGGMKAGVPYLANVGSHGLPAGRYEVTAYLIQGGKTAEQSERFTVAGAAGGRAGAGGLAAAEPTSPDVNWFEGASMDSSASGELIAAPPVPPGQLTITAAAKAAAAPPAEDAHTLIAAARDRALSYNDSLPNFICTEVTQRSSDKDGDGRWRLVDTLVEALSYRDKQEVHTTLELNGMPSELGREAMKGTFSSGEFGGVLEAVYREASKADFQWKETDDLKGATIEVFDYRVNAGNSTFSVSGPSGHPMVVGYHGQVFVDRANHRTRRVTLAADGLTPDSATHDLQMSVDYDYVAISGLKYLMPVSARLELKKGKNEVLVNTMEFRDYKRFSAE